MLIAQITDIHIGFEPDNPEEYNRLRLDDILRSLCAMTPLPDMLLATGDLVDIGDDDISYARFKQATEGLPFPVYPALGNHDGRASFLAHFPDVPTADGFVQYEIDQGPVRILVLDTLEEGRHGGSFCEIRAAWLRARLAEQPERPTVLVLHHPPIESGLSWMTENPAAKWVGRLHDVVSANRNIVALLAGHLHRPITTSWAGSTLAVCPSSAPLVAMDFEPIDPDRPDERPMIVADPPYFAIHVWTGSGLITHFETAGEHNILAHYGTNMQPLVRMLLDEKQQV